MNTKKFLAALVFLPALSIPAHAAETQVRLDHANVNVTDVISLQSGARTFVNYCLNCHSASLVRYDQLTRIGLTPEQVEANLMFTADKIGEPMHVAMTKEDAKAAFGVVPPDLSVIARSRSPDWLYTYLRSFYRDPKTVTGWNNTVYPNVAMPHVLWSLQGEQQLTLVPRTRDGQPVLDHHGKQIVDSKLEPINAGALTSLEYDRTVRDLVNFLAYIGEPHQEKRVRTGVGVVIALVLLIGLTFALKSVYWKDVH